MSETKASSNPSADSDSDEEQLPDHIEVTTEQTGTEFRDTILYVIAGLDEMPYGLAINRRLQDYYGEKIHHGRLYPNLDNLEQQGYVDKTTVDKRTNKYELTDKGRQYVLGDVAWKASQLGLSVQEAEHQEWSA